MNQLKRMRTEKGLSQAKLAALADIDPSTVNQIEREAREASPATLRKLAQALDVSIAELLEDKSPKAPRRSSFEPTLNGLLEEERRRTQLEEVRQSYREAREEVERYLTRWERWLETGGIPEEAVREFLVSARAWYPVLRELLIDELTAISGVLDIEPSPYLPEEAKAESALMPLVNRYWELGNKLTEIWNERFPEEAPVDFETKRREVRLRRPA